MHADQAIGTARCRGEGRYRDRRGVRREDHLGAQEFVRVAQHGKFQVQALGDGFDGKIGARNFRKIARRVNAPENFRFVSLFDPALFYFAVQVLRDRIAGANEKTFLHVAQNHVVAAAGKDVRDAVAHGSRAEHGYGPNCVECHLIS